MDIKASIRVTFENDEYRPEAVSLVAQGNVFSSTLMQTYIIEDLCQVKLCLEPRISNSEKLWGKIWITIQRQITESSCNIQKHTPPLAYFAYNEKQYKHKLTYLDTFNNQTVLHQGFDLRYISLFLTSWLLEDQYHCGCTFFLYIRGSLCNQDTSKILPFQLKKNYGS
jgi:hypothetical protein